jgi:hypothetical protein
MGFIVWDSNGRIYAVGCSSLDTYMEPVVAETSAALRAVELYRSRGFSNVWLEGDSL